MAASNKGISKILLMTVFAVALAGLIAVACDDDSSATETFTEGYYTFTAYDDEFATVTGFTGDAVDTVTVPDTAYSSTTHITYTVSGIGDAVFAGKTVIKTVTIGSTIKSVGNRAFSGCTGIATVTFGDNLEDIYNYAFDGCTSLTSITLPSKIQKVGEYAFRGCSSVTAVTFPANNSYYNTISTGTFSECIRLTSISVPSYVINIESYAFYKCSSLKTVTIPDESHLGKIGDYAFGRCSAITSFAFKSNLSTIGAGAFEYCTSLKDVTLPKRLTTIGNLAFYNCSSLTSINIPSSVTSIGYGPFAACKSLNNITVDSANSRYKTSETVLVDYGYTTVIQCPVNKESYSMPNTVITVGAYAFSGCDKLTELNIPSSVVDIGDYAFSYCNSLRTMELSSNVDIIGENVFFVCDSLEKITVDSANSNYYSSSEGILYTKDLSKLIKCPDKFSGVCHISSQVTSISETAFFNCKNLTEFNVDGSSTNYISDSAGVLYTKDYMNLLAYPCGSSAESYTINQQVSTISAYAFSSCSHLKNLNISSKNEFYRTTDGILYSYDQKTLIYYPSGRTDSTFSIISGVTAVQKYAFFSCTSLKNVKLVSSTIDFDPESLSIGSFGNKVEVNISGPTGYIFTDYAFNKYTDVPHPAEESSFISTEVLLIIAIIVVIVVVLAVYFKRRYSY